MVDPFAKRFLFYPPCGGFFLAPALRPWDYTQVDAVAAAFS
jgi:hypothetical protein